jgi:16S rRNA (uracil1498-N3)-methyltransferase
MSPLAAHSHPRLWSEAPLSQGAEVELGEATARHVAALRLREGDAVVLFDGTGGEHDASLLRMVRGRCTARVHAHRDVERESPLALTLALGISAGDRMDYALQKATELGVKRFVPLATERSVVRLQESRAERRLAHWRGVTVAACEQCGRNRLPPVEPVAGLDAFVAAPAEGLKLVLAPGGTARLATMSRRETITVLVGPEGGLSPRELEAAAAAGFVALRFGPRTLRTETAPVAAVAALQALWGDC